MADDAEEKLDKHDMCAEDYDGVPAPIREERYSGESLGDKHYHKGAEASSGEDNERVVGAIVILLEVHPPLNIHVAMPATMIRMGRKRSLLLAVRIGVYLRKM